MNLGLAKGDVRVVPYDANWPRRFDEEKADLLKALGDLAEAATIEHVGGTSVKGLASKPIIDIVIGFRSTREVDSALGRLRLAGRDYVKAANQPGMLFMAKGEVREFHYHLVVRGTPAWRKLFAFRNHLRRHPGLVAEYGAMKMVLAERFPKSRLDYMRYKRPFLRAILQRAFAESRRRRYALAVRQALAVADAESADGWRG